MSKEQRINIQIAKRIKRFKDVTLERGFGTTSKFANYAGVNPLVVDNFLKETDRKTRHRAVGEKLARVLGVSRSWLIYGRGKKDMVEQPVWFAAQRKDVIDFGPTMFPYGAKHIAGGANPTPSPQLPQKKPLLLLAAPKKHPPSWDPEDYLPELNSLYHSAKVETSARRDHHVRLTTIDVQRLTLCLLIDHHNGFVDQDYLKEISKDVRFHEVQSVSTKLFANVSPAKMHVYDLAIIYCYETIDKVAAELKINHDLWAPESALMKNFLAKWEKNRRARALK